MIAASAVGTSHALTNTECQDFFVCETIKSPVEILICVASDGAGSAKLGRHGAEMTCRAFVGEIRLFVEQNGGIDKLNRETVLEWLKLLQMQFALTAKHDTVHSRDFAATLLAAIVTETTAFFWQIGDGAIVFSESGDENFRLFVAPQQGEYANTTFFVTDETAAQNLQFEKLEVRVAEVALFSDGLQRIALDLINSAPHAPFFRAMFAPLRASNEIGVLQKQLSAFLDSPKINERTDDDKTLILASRRG